MSAELLLLGAGLLLAGGAAGFIGGLLGVGGGIVMTPVLYEIQLRYGVDSSVAMHVAVGTSLAVIAVNSVRSVTAHARRGAVDWALLARFGHAIFWGAAAGSALAAFVDGHVLRWVFVVFCLVFAAYMAFAPLGWTIGKEVPRGASAQGAAVGIGGVSALMGIGGGTFGVTAMTLFGMPIHRAVATGAGIGILIALPATIGFVAGGWGQAELPPYSLGYVSWGAFLLLAPVSTLAAPYGAGAAHALPKRALRIAFAVFLALAGLRMAMA